jgi:sigma-B regulation protein RsbU (phosphoserine phosphatase)
MSIIDVILELLARFCLIIVVVYLASRMRFFREVIDRDFNTANRILMILVFGLLSMYGIYSAVTLDSGAVVTLRDIAPIVAGLIGGPLIGLGAGLIGGIYTLAVEGFGAGPFAIATVVIGLAAGVTYNVLRGRLMRVPGAIIFGVVAECFSLAMLIAIHRPFAEAADVARSSALALVLANSLGVGILMAVMRYLAAEIRDIDY